MRRKMTAIALTYAALWVSATVHCQDGKFWEHPGTKAGEEIVGPDGGKMVWVPAGDFEMGAADIMPPVHHVRISKGFWIAKYPVTNVQYRQFCQTTGATFPEASNQGDAHPVVQVTWADALAYCKHYGLRLPTEAEWEYAARGAESRKYPWGNEWDERKCCNRANKGPNGRTSPVGSFPEDLSWCGAFDMAGNVCQWCNDWYGRNYYANSPNTDPPGPEKGESWKVFPPARVARGGGWEGDAQFCRSVYRGHCDPVHGNLSVGFRCAATP